MLREGTRAQVWHGTAKQTSGGLTKDKLFKDKNGRIRSKAASANAKRNNNLVKAGWVTKKGQFGAVRAGSRSPARKSPVRRSPARRSPARRSSRRSPARKSPRRSPRRSPARRSPARRSPNRRSRSRSPRRRRR
jgi:hypothetical protein